jgi:hypothetical protein
MTTASVELSRTEDGKHVLKVQTPNGCWANLYLEEIHSPVITAVIQWADYNLNRPATPIEELVDEFQSAVYEETVNRATYSMAKSTVAEDKAKLLAAIAHLKANHAEMVARNAVLRRRPDLQEQARTEAAVADALAEAGCDDSFRNKLYEELREIVPYTGEFEPGASVTIYWKPIEGEVGGPTADHGYVFIYPHEDAEVGACVHIPHPDPRGDRDVSPEWLTVSELLANILVERIEFKPATADGACRATGDGAQRLGTVEERYAREVALIQYLDQLGVLRIQRGLLAAEIGYAYKALAQGKAA